MKSLKKFLFRPETTKIIKFILDDCLPPVIRDNKFFYTAVVRTFNPVLDMDFKVKAPHMTAAELKDAYEKVVPFRDSHMTQKDLDFVINNLTGETVLELGCGHGDVAIACAKTGRKITATDLAQGNLSLVHERAKKEGLTLTTNLVNVESIPYNDKSFDTVICLHTLEHVFDLYKCINELKRVASKRLIVVVPQERYFRYSANYHVNFFGGPEQLLLAMKIKNSTCISMGGNLAFVGNL
ncbi:MAG: class I SAM-dependent methyltransferase [Chitinophagales bacterium]